MVTHAHVRHLSREMIGCATSCLLASCGLRLCLSNFQHLHHSIHSTALLGTRVHDSMITCDAEWRRMSDSEQIIREFSRLPENKTCVDCDQKVCLHWHWPACVSFYLIMLVLIVMELSQRLLSSLLNSFSLSEIA